MMEEEVEAGFQCEGSVDKDRGTHFGVREAPVQIFYCAGEIWGRSLSTQRD